MGKKGLRDSYKKLLDMVNEKNEADTILLELQEQYEDRVGMDLDESEDDLFDMTFDDPLFNEWLVNLYDEAIANGDEVQAGKIRKYMDYMQNLEESRGIVSEIIEVSKGRYRDCEERVKFCAEAMRKAGVSIDGEILGEVLDMLPEESKLSNLLERKAVLEGSYEDIQEDDLARLYRGVGKSIDELPEQMLTDSEFMRAYLLSKESDDPEFANLRFSDYRTKTYGEIVDRATELCDEEISQTR